MWGLGFRVKHHAALASYLHAASRQMENLPGQDKTAQIASLSAGLHDSACCACLLLQTRTAQHAVPSSPVGIVTLRPAGSMVHDLPLFQHDGRVHPRGSTRSLVLQARPLTGRPSQQAGLADLLFLLLHALAPSRACLQVLAGALQDNKRATIVGETTFGKGLIQTIVEMSDGSAVVATAARYRVTHPFTLLQVLVALCFQLWYQHMQGRHACVLFASCNRHAAVAGVTTGLGCSMELRLSTGWALPISTLPALIAAL